MKRILLFIVCIWSGGMLFSQIVNDGCMTINMDVTDSWVDEYEDPFFDDESAFRWYGADNAGLDGFGWRGGSCLYLDGAWFIGWRGNTHPVYSLFNQTYGASGSTASAVPLYLQLRGTYVGEDCLGGSNCNYDTGFFTCGADNDDYGYNDVLTSFLNFRSAGPPNTFNYSNRFTGNHGSSDFGAEVRSRYSAPKPTASVNITEVCDGVSTAVTFSFSGATYGGTYAVYNSTGTTLLHSTTSLSWTTNVSVTTTFRVYTTYSGTRSNCYELVTVSSKNCDFNCETESYNTSTVINPCVALTNIGATSLAFDGYGIPATSYIADVEVAINLSIPDGDEIHLMFYSENGGATENTSLVDGIEDSPPSIGCNFNGINYGTRNVIWDEDATTILGVNHVPVNNARVRSTCDNVQGVEFDKWEVWDTNNTRNWYISAGSDDINCDNTFTVNSYAVTVCGCKPPAAGSAFVTDNILPASNGSITICEEQGGNIELSVTGSTSLYSTNGFGEEVRWFSGSCGGTFLGTGTTLSIPAPTTAGTYNYFAEYYVEGERCRGIAQCDQVDVVVEAATVAGSLELTIAGTTSEEVCFGVGFPSEISIVGNTGSVNQWQISTDAATWSNVGIPGSSTYTPFTFIAEGTYYIRALVQNNTCDEKTTPNFLLEVKPPPVAGIVSRILPATADVCHNEVVSINVSGFTGTIQWQEASSASGPWSDVAFGGSSDNYFVFTNNTSGQPDTLYYRVVASGTPCPDDVSNVYALIVAPDITSGTTAPNQLLCYNETPSNLTLTGMSGGWVDRWEIDDVNTFASPTTISNTSNVLTGAEVQVSQGGTLTQTLYARAVIVNAGCNEEYSSVTTIRINDPDPIVGISASGTCNINSNGYVHLYDPVTDDIIVSVDANGQDLGDVTVNVYYDAMPFTVQPTLSSGGFCQNPQAVMNRRFTIVSANAPVTPVFVRFYFTDAELNNLIALAGCGDTDGCADDDDVCSINDLYVTQISGSASEDGTFDADDGTFTLHSPINSGIGNATFGANYVQVSLTGFSEFWIHGSESGVALPVELISFNANAIENNFIRLDWSTATEIENAGFDLERSQNGIDFETIAWIEGNGNTTAVSDYLYDDEEVVAGTYYYRLKQVDFNGDYEYSQIVAAEITKVASNNVGLFVPNPAESNTSIDVSMVRASAVKIVLFNNIGQRVISKNITLDSGNHTLDFDINDLPGGSYNAIISIGNDVVTRKLIVIN